MRLAWAATPALGRDSVLAISTLSGVLTVPCDAHSSSVSIDADKLPESVNLLETGAEVTALACSSRWLATGTSKSKVIFIALL